MSAKERRLPGIVDPSVEGQHPPAKLLRLRAKGGCVNCAGNKPHFFQPCCLTEYSFCMARWDIAIPHTADEENWEITLSYSLFRRNLVGIEACIALHLPHRHDSCRAKKDFAEDYIPA